MQEQINEVKPNEDVNVNVVILMKLQPTYFVLEKLLVAVVERAVVKI